MVKYNDKIHSDLRYRKGKDYCKTVKILAAKIS